MNIEIMSREDARRASFHKNRPTTAIISITDVHSAPNAFHRQPWLKDVLQLQFDDVVAGMRYCMTPGDAEAIRDFVWSIQGRVEQLIVHCEYGISRSAGVAAAVTKYLYGDDSGIWGSWKYSPNRTCYEMVLGALGHPEAERRPPSK